MAQVLLVCTGNICRSPMAEGFLRSAFEQRLANEAPRVVSAGVIALEGGPATAEAVTAAAEFAVDISGHTARHLVRGDVEGADLVVGMSAEHRDVVVEMVPEAASTAFTLKELVRLLEAAPDPPGAGAPEEVLVARVTEADRRRRTGFAVEPTDEDVVDPIGLPFDAYRAVAWELQGWCRRLADGLFDRSPVRAGRGE